jgi:phenylacetate-coenzyme A ligase PaaK-like adenylate-forming protein
MELFSKRLYSWIILPEREAETVWVADSPFNWVDVERGVFQQENMDYLTGGYKASLYGDAEETTLRVSMECLNASNCAKGAGQGEFPREFPAVPATPVRSSP